MKRTFTGVFVALCLTLSIVSAGEKVYKMQAGTSIAAGTPKDASWDVCYFETLKEYVERESGGRLEIAIFYGNSLGSDADVIAGVANGTIELFTGEISMTSPYYTPSLLFSIPGAFASVEQANALFVSDWGRKFFADLEAKTGIKILGASAKGFRNFTTVKKELKTVDDIKGLSLRTMNNPLFIRMVEALGAVPVPMDISELYSALQNGVVDGHENSVPNILQDKTYELEKFLVLDAHSGSFNCGAISAIFFNSLPADLQKIILDGNDAAMKAVIETMVKVQESGIEKLKAEGVSIYQPTPAELKAWQAAYQKETMELAKERIGADIVDGFLKALAGLKY